MNRDQIDELMRVNGIVVVGEAVYRLVQLVVQHEREALPDRKIVTAAGDPQDYMNEGWNDCIDAIRAERKS